MRRAGHLARMGEGRGVYRFLVGKPEEKRPLGIPRRRGKDNIKMDLQEVGCGLDIYIYIYIYIYMCVCICMYFVNNLIK
jgi:hypothetical protein